METVTNMTLGSKVRRLFREIFGSRLASFLEAEMFRLRSDFQVRISEKDQVIDDLRLQVASLEAKIARMELVLLPLSTPSGAAYARSLNPPPPRTVAPVEDLPPTSWQLIQEQWATKSENQATATEGN